MNMTDEMYEAAIKRFRSEQGTKGGNAKLKKYGKEGMSEMGKKGGRPKKTVNTGDSIVNSVDN